MAQVLEFLSGYARPLASAPDGALGTHRLVEAFKHAFAMRMNLGDPEVPPPNTSNVPNISGAVRDMLSPAFNAALRAMTKDDATLPLGAYGARWNLVEDHGTTHVSVVDADRNAVAMNCKMAKQIFNANRFLHFKHARLHRCGIVDHIARQQHARQRYITGKFGHVVICRIDDQFSGCADLNNHAIAHDHHSVGNAQRL